MEKPTSAPAPDVTAAPPDAPPAPTVAPAPSPEAQAEATAAVAERHDAAVDQVQTASRDAQEILRSSVEGGAIQTIHKAKEWLKSDEAKNKFSEEEMASMTDYLTNTLAGIFDVKEMIVGKQSGNPKQSLLSFVDDSNKGFVNFRKLNRALAGEIKTALLHEADPLQDREMGTVASAPVTAVVEAPQTAAPEAPTTGTEASPSALESPSSSIKMTPEESQNIKETFEADRGATIAIESVFDVSFDFVSTKMDELKPIIEGILIVGPKKVAEIDHKVVKARKKKEEFILSLRNLDLQTYPKPPKLRDYTGSLAKLPLLEKEALDSTDVGIKGFEEALGTIGLPDNAKPILQAVIAQLKLDKGKITPAFTKKRESLMASKMAYETVQAAIASRAEEMGSPAPDAVALIEGVSADSQAELVTRAAEATERVETAQKAETALPSPTDSEKAADALEEVFSKKEDLLKAFSDGDYGKAIGLAFVMLVTVFKNLGVLMNDSGGLMKLWDRIFPGDETSETPAVDSVEGILENFSITAENDRLSSFKDIPMSDLLKHQKGKTADFSDPKVKETLDKFKTDDPNNYTQFMTEILETNGGKAFVDAAVASSDTDKQNMTLDAFIQANIKSWKNDPE